MKIGSVIALVVAMLVPVAAQPPTITVSAAISLTDVLEELGRAYRGGGNGVVRFNFAASNTLARQIVNGAPTDLFISADEAQMHVVEAAGGIVQGARVDLLGNRLAVATVPSLASSVREARDLLRPEVKRIAIGDPQAVPAGVYGRAYLQSAGVWDGVSGKIVPVANVRAALAAVDTGSAEAAIVYDSDMTIAESAAVAFVVSGPQAPRIVYPAAVVTSSKNRAAAERFLAFLRGARASEVFRRYRFIPLAEQR